MSTILEWIMCACFVVGGFFTLRKSIVAKSNHAKSIVNEIFFAAGCALGTWSCWLQFNDNAAREIIFYGKSFTLAVCCLMFVADIIFAMINGGRDMSRGRKEKKAREEHDKIRKEELEELGRLRAQNGGNDAPDRPEEPVAGPGPEPRR